jgi:hypothetical protein
MPSFNTLMTFLTGIVGEILCTKLLSALFGHLQLLLETLNEISDLFPQILTNLENV